MLPPSSPPYNDHKKRMAFFIAVKANVMRRTPVHEPNVHKENTIVLAKNIIKIHLFISFHCLRIVWAYVTCKRYSVLRVRLVVNVQFQVGCLRLARSSANSNATLVLILLQKKKYSYIFHKNRQPTFIDCRTHTLTRLRRAYASGFLCKSKSL